MKKIYLMAALFVATTISGQNADFESIILVNESYWNGSDYSGTTNGVGLFDTTITDGFHEFSNQYDTTWGASWGFWSGWAFSNQTADTTSGLPGQYSSYAGGAYNGSNYAIGQDGSEIILAGGVSPELLITNVNYAAYSMLNGDSFGKEFGSQYDANGSVDGTDGEDWFLLKILCYNLSDVLVDSVELYLADYRFADNTQDYIQKDWTTVSLNSSETLGRLKFSLTSSDEGQSGMNTPAFFAIDNLSAGSVNIEENELAYRIFPNPAIDIVNIQTNSDKGTIEIFDITGKQISSKNYTSEMFQVNVSSFPAGTYYAVLSSEGVRQTTKIVKL
ncbi:DUF4465 domain-containing protein [Flavobacteriales bacterium]|nr:DUF4465 domain-containing protein [Flavobacteriales bacterium]